MSTNALDLVLHGDRRDVDKLTSACRRIAEINGPVAKRRADCHTAVMTTFFTSDTHFGDMRILRIDKRPFKSLAEHDAALIDNWNAAVSPDDTVWHLGDFALGPKDDEVAGLIARLNGTKHLLIGNNDGPGTLDAPGWASVGYYVELDIEGTHVVLCHYAFRTWNAMGRGALNLHGHSHGLLKTAPKQFDVGVDVWDYRPVTLEEIRTRPRMTRIKRFGSA